MELEIKVLDWDRHKNVTGISLLMGPSLFDKWVFALSHNVVHLALIEIRTHINGDRH
jgi:hypothetical protein